MQPKFSFASASENIIKSACFHEQTIESLLSVELWMTICPFLNLQSSFSNLTNNYTQKQYDQNQAELNQRGYFKVTNDNESFIPIQVCENLAIGIKRLVAHGYPPNFILMFDKSWHLGTLLSSILVPSSKNLAIGDWFIFLVDPSNTTSYQPGGPHRDRPTATHTSFRMPQNEPMYCSVWLALTDATCDNSCLYLVPKGADKGYHGEGEELGVPVLGDIVAQPLKAGGFLAFSHRLMHWGSKVQPTFGDERVRIALSLAFADREFEEAYFDDDLAECPPLALRLGLIAGQQIQYLHMSKLDKHGLSLYRRIFCSQKKFFNTVYFEKTCSTAQFNLYKMSQK